MAARAPFITPRAPWSLQNLGRGTSRRLACLYSVAAANNGSAPSPPLIQKLKAELKDAMRARDTQRLAVLRTIMSENLNASKTASPIETDLQLVALIRRLKKGAEDAAAEARAAGRNDLVDKEQGQASLYDEYIANSGIPTVAGAELKNMVERLVEESKAAGTPAKNMVRDVMLRVNKVAQGKDVDRREVTRILKDLIHS